MFKTFTATESKKCDNNTHLATVRNNDTVGHRDSIRMMVCSHVHKQRRSSS